MNIVKGIDRIAVVLAIIVTIPGFIFGWSYFKKTYEIKPSDVQWSKPFINPKDVIWDQEDTKKPSSFSNSENIIQTPLSKFRKKYPCYNDLTDEELSRALHKKYYSDLTIEDFSSRIGYKMKSSGDVFDKISFEEMLQPEKWQLISYGLTGALVFGITLFLFITISSRIIRFVSLWVYIGFKGKS